MKANRRALLAAAIAGIAIGTSAQAATITWSGANVISGDSDVINTGTLVNATNVDGSNVTVNGTAFTGASGSTIVQGNLTVSIPGGLTDAGSAYYTNGGPSNTPYPAPFGNLSANYQNVIGTGDYQDNGSDTETVTYTGLTVGHLYQLEFFVNDSRTCCSNNLRNETLTSGANSVNLPFYNQSGTNGGVGSFATGTFKADSTTQSYSVTSPSNNIQNNAFVLVDVPEPASLGLLGLGGLSLLARRRRNA